MISRESSYVIWTIVILLAVPLALKLIGPNHFYGFRSQLTLANDSVWYRGNSFLGYALIIAGFSAVFFLWSTSGTTFAKENSWIPLAATFAPIVLAVGSTVLYINHLK